MVAPMAGCAIGVGAGAAGSSAAAMPAQQTPSEAAPAHKISLSFVIRLSPHELFAAVPAGDGGRC
jgi:hypothetical protein